MKTQMLPILSNSYLFQIILCIGLGLVSNTYVFIQYELEIGLFWTFGTILFYLWAAIAHLKLALPILLKKPINFVRYFWALAFVLTICIFINAFFTWQAIRLNPVIHSRLLDNVPRFALFVSIEAILFIAVSSSMKFSFDYFKLQAQQRAIENQKLDAELKYLKGQINPHFLFNTLNNLLLLTNKRSPKASRVVEKLAYMMRYLLEKDKKERVPLLTEIEFLKAYLELEQIRVKNLDVSFDIEGEIKGQQVPPALFITLVENAFKHGVQKSASANYVHIELKASPKTLQFQVWNPLRKQHTALSSHSIGLSNLRKRLDLLFKDNYELTIGAISTDVFAANLTLQII